jgi:hypothetical protein
MRDRAIAEYHELLRAEAGALTPELFERLRAGSGRTCSRARSSSG